jgi:hypothetical protein
MSEVKVNKITPRTDCGTTQLGDSGDTVTVTGDLRSDSLKAADGGVIISQSGTTITVGASGDTVSLASGASQTGFGRSGAVDWQTTVKTSGFTATAGEGYFVDTSSSAISVNLPAGTAGAVVGFSDYGKSFDTNALTLVQNGSDKIGGSTDNQLLVTEGVTITLVFIDSTKGWIVTDSGLQSDTTGDQFITATGGTITTVCTNFKVHTFTGPGTFCVSKGAGPVAVVDYMVVAGGGGGGGGLGGGGGAGGYRESGGTSSGCYAVSPLSPCSVAAIPVSPGPMSIAVGGGGAGRTSPGATGTTGSVSTFSTITSAGGGGGGTVGTPPNNAGGSGGSGGGGAGQNPSSNPGAGNTPPVSPPQGQNGGVGDPNPGYFGGGGGGATASGNPGTTPSTPGKGGAGAATTINGTPTTRGGGGSGGGDGPGQPGGNGGGGKAGDNPEGTGTAGTANTGGGGGGGSGGGPTGGDGAAGGSGIVILRYKFQ